MNKSLFEETRRFILGRMREQLAAGNHKMQTEKELASEVLASYATVRLVMKELEQEGFIRRIQGSGTYLQPEAGRLLEEASWPRLRLFSSPLSGEPDLNYADWLIQEIKEEARQMQRRVEHVQVRTHDEFLERLSSAAEPGDAVVYLPPTEPFSMRQLGELGRHDKLPLIVIDCELGNINVGNITTDNRRGGMLAARALIENGCRELAVLLCEPMLRQISQRVQGFLEIAEMSGIKPVIIDCEVHVEDSRQEKTRTKLRDFLKSEPLPDGLFAVSDCGAFAAMEVLRESGIEAGSDLSLIGFDGLAAGRQNHPVLTTVAQPVTEICRKVFQDLREWRSGTHPQHLLSPVLRPGETLNRACRKLA